MVGPAREISDDATTLRFERRKISARYPRGGEGRERTRDARRNVGSLCTERCCYIDEIPRNLFSQEDSRRCDCEDVSGKYA